MKITAEIVVLPHPPRKLSAEIVPRIGMPGGKSRVEQVHDRGHEEAALSNSA